MSEESNNFHDELKRMNQKACSDIETRYAELIALLNRLDPIKLLSQLTLTFLTVPEDQFNDESSDIHQWARWIEFLAGYLLTHDYPQNARREI